MSLRVRLAVIFGAFAIVVVAAVSAVGYVTTGQRMRDEVDDVLTGYAAQLASTDGRAAVAVCDRFVRPDDELPARRRAARRALTAPILADFAGALVRCTDVPQIGSTVIAHRPEVSPITTEEIEGVSYRVLTVVPVMGGRIEVARSAEEADRVLSRVRAGSIVIGAAVTALAAAAGWLVARWLVGPLERLTAAAEEVAVTGRLDVEVPPSGADETGRLARSFAAMLRALQDSRARQQRLAQDAGHELRTPITSLRANIGALRRHPDMAVGTRDQLLDDLDIEVRELSGMVDGLVTLAADGSSDEAVVDIDLHAVVTRSVARARRRTGRTIELAAAPVVVRGREGQYSTIVDNLLDNAAKFSTAPSKITVLLENSRLEVCDRGPGISESELPLVFERFHRSEQARGLPGSGLGLSIVADCAAANGARISAANHPEGGAVFTLWLPPAS